MKCSTIIFTWIQFFSVFFDQFSWNFVLYSNLTFFDSQKNVLLVHFFSFSCVWGSQFAILWPQCCCTTNKKTLEISTSITIKAFRITDWFLLRLEFCAWEISTLDLTTSISCCCCSMLKFISSPLFPIQFQPVNYIHRRSLYVECFAKKSNFLRFLVVENGCELRVYLSVESRRRIHNRNDQMQKPINHFSWFTWTYIKPSTKFIAKHGEGNIV